MMQRKVTKGREALCGKLEDIQKGQVGLALPWLCVWLELEADSWVAGWQVIVVFDGKRGEAATETETDGGMRVGVPGGASANERTPS